MVLIDPFCSSIAFLVVRDVLCYGHRDVLFLKPGSFKARSKFTFFYLNLFSEVSLGFQDEAGCTKSRVAVSWVRSSFTAELHQVKTPKMFILAALSTLVFLELDASCLNELDTRWRGGRHVADVILHNGLVHCTRRKLKNCVENINSEHQVEQQLENVS